MPKITIDHDPNHCWCQYVADERPTNACICDQLSLKDTNVTKMERTKDGERQEIYVAIGAEHIYEAFGWTAVETITEEDEECFTDLPIG